MKQLTYIYLLLLALVWVNTSVFSQTPVGTRIDNIGVNAYELLNGTPDSTLSNLVTFYVQGVNNLVLTKTVNRYSVLPGDTVEYRIAVYNFGNITATGIQVVDTIPTLLRIISTSGGIVSGQVVSWSVGSLSPAQSDSISITVLVVPEISQPVQITNTCYAADTTGTELTASVDIFVNAIPNLNLQKIVSKDSAVVGDMLEYKIILRNTGNIPLTDVFITDTIPAQLTDISVSPNAQLTNRVVNFSKDTMFVDALDTITVYAKVFLNFPRVITNKVYAESRQTQMQSAQVTTLIKTDDADRSCLMLMTAEPKLIIGNGINASTISVLLTDTLGRPKPDGTPILMQCLYPTATFSNGMNSIMVPTRNGWAIDSLKALIVTNEIVRTFVIATALDTIGCTASDTVEVIFFPGAIAGIVIDNNTQLPVAGAIVRVYSSSDSLVGEQITLSDGRYLIPVPRTDNYRVEIIVRSVFGYTTTTTSVVIAEVPGIGGVPPVLNKNSFSGTIYYLVSNQPIAVENVKIVLRRAVTTGVFKNNRSNNEPVYVEVDSTYSNSLGWYQFTDLQIGSYEVIVRHSKITGSQLVNINVNGKTIVNVNIPVLLNPELYFTKSGPATVSDKDTITYSIRFGNTGTLRMTNAVLIDSLDPLMNFVSATNGGIYESQGHRIVWNIGTIDTASNYIYSVKVTLKPISQNVSVFNKATITTDETIPENVEVKTDVFLSSQFRIWKTASVQEAPTGDTVFYTIKAVNNGGSRADSVNIVDDLPAEVQFIEANPSGIYDSLTHTVSWFINSINPGDTVTITIKTVVKNLPPGEYQYTNIATLEWRSLRIPTTLDHLTNANVRTFVSYIQITKRAVRKILEVGDIATYVLKVTNNSPISTARNVEVRDRIPFGFKYLKGSSYRDTTRIADPNGDKELVWYLTDALLPNSSIQITYRLIAGAGSVDGDGINTAQAFGQSPNNNRLISNLASEKVEIQRGIFTERGIIIGKVFYDYNLNAYQDEGEDGVKGIELMLEDGSRVLTGDDGKYSFPDVSPGEHVIKVRKHTLPKGSELLLGYTDFANDAASRFVKLTESGIARADFYLGKAKADTIILNQTIAKAGTVELLRIADPKNIVFIEDERIAPIMLRGTNFEVGKADLLPTAYPILKGVGSILNAYDDQKLIITGHTDSNPINTKEFPNNQVLSEARARTVKEYLVREEKVDPARIEIVGYGPDRPVATNKTVEGRALNRRVEFFFQGTTELERKTTSSILFKIPIHYEGSVSISKIEIKDMLDSALHYVEGSAMLGDSSIIPRIEGNNLYWTIENVGNSFHQSLQYRVLVYKPVTQRVSYKSTSSVKLITSDTVIQNENVVSTTNNLAVAVKGKAVNFVFSGVVFEVGKATFRPEMLSALENAARVLKDDPTSTAIIEGHTDSKPIKTAEFPSNVELSQARAKVVAELFTKEFGIASNRLQSFGWGEMRPVATNATPEGRQLNRRTEVRIFKKEFTDQVLQEGLIDSSQVIKQIILPNVNNAKFDTTSSGNIGDRFLLKLEVKKAIDKQVLHTTLFDTLPAGLAIVPNSISIICGIDSISTKENILTAVCSANDTVSALTFLAEITSNVSVDSIIQHTFTVQRQLKDGSILINKIKPVIIEIRKIKR